MEEQSKPWDFFTNHTRVLFVIARETAPRIRDIAALCDITERTAQKIVTDQRHGRRTHYTLCLDGTLRHPADAHVPIAKLHQLATPHHDPAHRTPA
ncbi:AsnC family transcriptional regulator [Streptomyces sp. NPDC048200]|uniref:AsnC family transcriptional regulator n=1 Tax=Streptomyces sp. NPDC048200 TaxID=3365512 RepID=UPI00371FAE00